MEAWVLEDLICFAAVVFPSQDLNSSDSSLNQVSFKCSEHFACFRVLTLYYESFLSLVLPIFPNLEYSELILAASVVPLLILHQVGIPDLMGLKITQE